MKGKRILGILGAIALLEVWLIWFSGPAPLPREEVVGAWVQTQSSLAALNMIAKASLQIDANGEFVLKGIPESFPLNHRYYFSDAKPKLYAERGAWRISANCLLLGGSLSPHRLYRDGSILQLEGPSETARVVMEFERVR